MKNVLWVMALLIGCLNQVDAQQKFEFSGKKINISGWATHLKITGHKETFVSIVVGVDNKSKKMAKYEEKGNELNISLESDARSIQILVPENTNLNVAMESVVWETNFDEEKDWRRIKIEDTKGELEFDGDGYHVDLQDVGGSVAVVTYGDINAVFSDLSESEVISLDTYTGNVAVEIPASASADLTMRAKNGEVKIAPDLKISGTGKKSKKELKAKLNGGEIPILIHSERGRFVSLEGN